MLPSFAVVAGSLFCHSSAARILPATLKLIAPALGWLFTTISLRSYSAVIYLLLQGVTGVASVVALKLAGSECALAQRSLYFPFLSGVVGGIVGHFLRYSGLSISSTAVVFVMLLQVWASLGGLVMLAVYPASIMQVIDEQAKREARYRYGVQALSTQSGKSVERSMTASMNGLMLDTVIVKQTRVPSDKWMMYFGGNAEFLENTLFEVSQEADLFGANLILFNPRGVGRSNGYVSQVSDLVEDAAAVSQYVVKMEKIQPRNLILFGHSIGGGVAAQVAYRVFPDATLVLDRTFSSLTDAASSFSPLTPAITQLVFPLLVGELNSVEAWNGMPHQRKMILYSRSDEIITYEGSSIARLPQFQPRQSEARYVLELTGLRQNCHNALITEFDQRSTIATYVKRCVTV